jgi:putative ATP-binding cassette transporter
MREVLRHFWHSDVGKKAAMMLATLFVLVLGVNGLNVINSYVGRDFMTALAERKTDEFIHQATLYIGVFAASTLVAVYYRFVEERLGLMWRSWYTRKLILAFLNNRTYFRLKEHGDLENPDERITEDVKSFTVTTLSFLLLILNGSITVIAFSGVIWSISPTLFGVTVLYSTVGSYLAIKFGRPLITLNYSQLDKEANFRSTLIHLWENAESVSLSEREEHLKSRLLKRLEDLTNTGNRIIGVHRNLGYFTTSYNYLIQILPVLVVAPLYLKGEVEFGVITQSSMAFAHLVGAFSLVVNQFQSISSFAAVIARLGNLGQLMEQGAIPSEQGALHREWDDQALEFRNMTLHSATADNKILLAGLNLHLPSSARVGICGSNESAKDALFRAVAGIRTTGSGTLARPGQHNMLFLSERPYLPPGSLRDVLKRGTPTSELDDERIAATLNALGLGPLLARVGNLDSERDWTTLLSLPEQQLVAIATTLLSDTRMVFLNRATSALTRDQTTQVLQLLTHQSVGYLVIGKIEKHLDSYDQILELFDDGHWTFTPTTDLKAELGG